MLLVISPAKKLDFETVAPATEYTLPEKIKQSQLLIDVLKKKSSDDLQQLMGVSEKIADLNVERYQTFQTPFTPDNAKQALWAFKGDVYASMQPETFSDKEQQFAQDHLRILSGLYGVLRPLDLIQAYRLEMGTSLANDKGKDLYQFWGSSITDQLNADLKSQQDQVLVNLASNEYFHAVQPDHLDGQVLNVTFKENKNGTYKIIGLLAKKARGMMSRYVITNQIQQVEDLKNFTEGGYEYREDMSSDGEMVFTR